jgi:hypothetical protein
VALGAVLAGGYAVLVLVLEPQVFTVNVDADKQGEVRTIAINHVAILALCLVLGIHAEQLPSEVRTLKGVALDDIFSGVSVGDLHSVSSDYDATLHHIAHCHWAIGLVSVFGEKQPHQG